ncbi:hypothetical protein DCAR_0625177 [Daucus carota subsp. sativus]|uniref:RNase III domain-containing protein n=1 Tax=Daucus carota subsp. sativus TaxID=79200 RepID=A0A164W9Q9_DAUCS|nr:PREDICTED: ribonuclease 3-like protein 3 [Daucus carota subsp. sativus]WOH05756.1 hypothetical protein DCAR_0625177 [Daucus carota subsp. sativus]
MEEITEQFRKLDPESSENLQQVEEIIGYSFRNKGLLEEAYTDPSYTKNPKSSYERLEFLGDTVLNFLMGTELFSLYPDLMPGELTQLRSANVSTEKLARAAAEHGLYRFLRHDKPLLSAQIEEFVSTFSRYSLSCVGLIDAPKTLANIVESTIGAVFVDCNNSNEITSKVIKKLLQPIIIPSTMTRHPVTLLFEICQKNGFHIEVIDSWQENGQIEIMIANKYVGRGEYKTKKAIAYNRAAADAYNDIVEKHHVDDS